MRQKMYSSALNDIIEAGHADAANLTTTSYNGLAHSLIAQHLLGQKQYELTNHLGNVQATLSDKRYVKTLSGTGATATRDYFNAALVAAYDYYPYGMLMPGRWTSDTDAHCSTLSLTQLVPHKTNTDIAGGTALSPSFSLIHGATAVTPTTGLGTTSGYTVYGRGGGISKTLTVTSGVPIAINISIPYIYGSFITISVRETKAGVTSVLASKNVSAASSYVLNVTPTTGSISIVAEAMSSFAAAPSSGLFTLGYLGYEQVTYVPENVLVNLCSDNKDKYEFGYNTQMKVNEIAGIGNWNTAQFWEYDTRTGVRANMDPVRQANESPYSINHSNPIVSSDPLGDFGSRKEAREYKKSHDLNGKITKSTDGIFYIDDKKSGYSYSRDYSYSQDDYVIGRQRDGVIRSNTIYKNQSNNNSSSDGASAQEAQSGGGEQKGYQLADVFGQLMNTGGVVWGVAVMGGNYLRQNNGAQVIGRSLGFGTQQTARALRGTVKTLGAWGKNLGTAGMILSSINYVAQGLDSRQTISTATHVNFWLGAGLYGAAAVIGGPIIGGAALIYGTGQLGSYIFTGNTLEENYFGK